MPEIQVNGTTLFYEEHGTGQQTVFMAHGLALNGRMYHNQVMPLRQRFRCITMDFRGQGRSAVATTGYDMDTLARDVAAVLRKLGAGPCHYIGLSMGGFVGLRLALREPALLRSLTLINTGAEPDSLSERIRSVALTTIVRLFGTRPVAAPAMRLLFGPSFRHDAEQRRRWHREVLANNRTGIVRAAAGVRQRAGLLDQIAEIDLPTLIIAGEEDHTMPVYRSRQMQERIAGSELVVIPGAGHNCCLEAPDLVNNHLLRFLG